MQLVASVSVPVVDAGHWIVPKHEFPWYSYNYIHIGIYNFGLALFNCLS